MFFVYIKIVPVLDSFPEQSAFRLTQLSRTFQERTPKSTRPTVSLVTSIVLVTVVPV